MKLQKATKKDYKDFKALYTKAFPRYERKPIFMMIRNFNIGKYVLYVLKDNNNFAGFLSVVPVKDSDIVMLDYLAVDSSLRGKGYGTIILDQIREVYKDKKIFLTMEQVTKSADNYEQRLKRKAFYTRNGWLDTGILTDGASGKMHVLAPYPETIKPEDYITAQTYALGKVLMKLGKMKIAINKSEDF